MANSSNEMKNPLATNSIPVEVRFWTYLILDVVSVACSFFVLYYLLFDRIIRHALNNHIIIVLLFVGLINELTSIPWLLYRYRYGVPLIQSSLFYLSSFFFNYASFTTQIILFAWATLERHILIFHHQWMLTRTKRFFFHYLPIIVITIYCLVYYSVITFGPFCKNSFVSFLSGGFIIPCVYEKKELATWELLAHQVTPTLIIVISSIALILRVLQQKRKVHQPNIWRKHRKMTIQLVSISVLYMAFNFPWTMILFASEYGIPENISRSYTFYGLYFRNYIIFLYPFVCCAALTELRSKIKQICLCCRRRERVAPHASVQNARKIHG